MTQVNLAPSLFLQLLAPPLGALRMIWDDCRRQSDRYVIVIRTMCSFLVAFLAFSAEPHDYRTGMLQRWDMLSTGTTCSTSTGLFSNISTNCGKTGLRVYHIQTADGQDYTVLPDTWDPLKTVSLGHEVSYRIDDKGQFWTPDPKHGSCPWPCSGEKRREFKKSGDPNHEAKYYVSLVEKSNTNSSALTNKDVLEMLRLGLSEAVIAQKISTSRTAFDLPIPALKSLKDSGVSDTLISIMMEHQNQ